MLPLQAQKIVPEEEWDAFVNTLKQPLPVAMRLSSLNPYAHLCVVVLLAHPCFSGFVTRFAPAVRPCLCSIRERLQSSFASKDIEVDGEVTKPPRWAVACPACCTATVAYMPAPPSCFNVTGCCLGIRMATAGS